VDEALDADDDENDEDEATAAAPVAAPAARTVAVARPDATKASCKTQGNGHV